jgi:hypothetical protein
MTTIPPIPDHVFHEAVAAFWDERIRSAEAQRLRGMVDQGERASVTSGQQLNGFIAKMVELAEASGVNYNEVQLSRGEAVLPGFFRATKNWDLVIVRKQALLASIELKSQVGPSFGNNYNNRSEEAIGSAVDLWTAFRENAFGGAASRPWLGYLFVLSDEPGSRSPVGVTTPHFPVFPEFDHASYAKRYELLLRRLVLERHYDAACFITTDRAQAKETDNYREPAADLGAAQFLDKFLRHVAP